MSLVIIIGIVWGAAALIRSWRQAQAEKARAAAQARRDAEARRMREEMREAQQRAREETARLIAVEREQQRLRREQDRQRREQERQQREQERQAAILAKHEEQLVKLQQQVELAEREIAHYSPIVAELRAESERLSALVDYYQSKGLLCGGYRDQLAKVNERLYQVEGKVIKAQFAKSNAERKMIA